MTALKRPLPACITRDNLTSPYFPSLSPAGLAAIAALAIVFLLTSFNRLNPTDLYGHLNFGRWMAEHQTLPANDPFAAVASQRPVFHTAWLAQLVSYEAQRLFGNEGLVLGHAMLVTLTAGVLILAVYRRGAPAGWAWSAGLVMFALDLPIVGTIRPQLFGQLGAALLLLACAEMPNRKHPLIWLPVVAALWANLHGSIPIGLAILGIHAISVTWEAYRKSRPEKFGSLIAGRKLWVVWSAPLLVLAASALNPHGLQLLPKIVLFNGHAALASISEWRPLTPLSLTGVLMMGSAVLTMLLARLSPRRWQVGEILLLLVFGLATVSAIRMLAWWAVVWPWVSVPHAAAAWRWIRGADVSPTHTPHPGPLPEGEGGVEIGPRPTTSMASVLAMGIVFATILLAPPTHSLVAGIGRGEGAILTRGTPIYAADEIIRRDLLGNIATTIDWADYLVWKSDQKLKPLVYSHVHLSEPGTWHDYEAIFRGDESWPSLLRAHGIQYLLVPRGRCRELARRVLFADRDGKDGVRIIYQDQDCLLAELDCKLTS